MNKEEYELHGRQGPLQVQNVCDVIVRWWFMTSLYFK